ncbi:hypothetical protein EV193_105398 [Herbihabitans rhizosphaerae]|uniref:Uncharacterized protein n=1 Tax=Herbihabitans rhizosphaerae TaxID=1872711 RepID=A0A4Q7KMD2_9PSEU|nr:hypothetical protein [Herbihabitans rhizosphaerae]RZS37838.1 hypothetical protein EV193_105398 [Herbihabitans rhizosphaerae]
MSFNVTCTPGKDAAAGFVEITSELPALVMYLDPVNLAIQIPPFPGGDRALARFCRELSREAARLAAAVDPDSEPASGRPYEPRHRLFTSDDNGVQGGQS